jgi:hypothetical protein
MPERKPLTAQQQAEIQAAKHTKFVELANQRVNKALAAINQTGRLANTQAYSFGKEEVQAIKLALLDEVKRISDRFGLALEGKKVEVTGGFSLDSAVVKK